MLKSCKDPITVGNTYWGLGHINVTNWDSTAKMMVRIEVRKNTADLIPSGMRELIRRWKTDVEVM